MFHLPPSAIEFSLLATGISSRGGPTHTPGAAVRLCRIRCSYQHVSFCSTDVCAGAHGTRFPASRPGPLRATRAPLQRPFLWTVHKFSTFTLFIDVVELMPTDVIVVATKISR